jgi:hypothetical protein
MFFATPQTRNSRLLHADICLTVAHHIATPAIVRRLLASACIKRNIEASVSINKRAVQVWCHYMQCLICNAVHT